MNQIYQALPHRPPMLLVDEIVSQDQCQIVCRKTFRVEEYFFQGHYPDYPLVPGVILCECGVQSGAILLAGHVVGGDSVPVLTKLDNVRFKKMVRPGETIEMHVQLDEQLAIAFYMSAKIICENQTAARFSFVCTATRKAESR